MATTTTCECDYCGRPTDRTYRVFATIGSMDGPPKALTGKIHGDHMPGARQQVPGKEACADCYAILESILIDIARGLLLNWKHPTCNI